MKRRSFIAMMGLAPAIATLGVLPKGSASASVKHTAGANQARWHMEARTAGGWQSAGMFLDVPDQNELRTRIIFDAKQFRVS